VMELGGHAPLIVFDDTDLDRAVKIAIDAKFATSGQDCLAANRIYVQRPLYEKFCAAFAERIEALKVADGLNPNADIGPLMHERAVRKVVEQVADALAKGAKLMTGGRRAEAGAPFHQPTLLADVPDAVVQGRGRFNGRLRQADTVVGSLSRRSAVTGNRSFRSRAVRRATTSSSEKASAAIRSYGRDLYRHHGSAADHDSRKS